MRLAPLLLLSGCAITTLATRGRSFPDADTMLEAGVLGATSIHRDALGIPHIRATHEVDGWYALGLVHAQDRAFQADLGRRIAWGELSEWFGDGLVDYDAFVRSLQLRAHAERTLRARATPAQRSALVAYADGFNAGVASLPVLPVEYRLRDLPFEPWTAADCLAQAYTMGWSLSENAEYELLALHLADWVDTDALDALLRTHAEDPPLDLYWQDLRTVVLGDFTPEFEAFTGILGGAPGEAEASNNWVVGPSKSADGMPILANDPHLSQRVPSLWYTAELHAGELHVAGATLPGNPVVLIGHNEDVAWGLTNGMADVVDFAVVERSGDNGYVLAGEERLFEHVQARIDVKGGESVERDLLVTEIGPVVTTQGGEHVLVMRWAAPEVEDHSLGVFWGLARASSVADALVAADQPMVVVQNLVVADTAGDFAWQLMGGVVRRRNHSGRVPYPASDPAYGWQGWLDRLPGEHAPAKAYVATANARPDHGLASVISTSHVPGWRQQRIDDMLGAAGPFSVEDMTAMQHDWLDTFAAWLLEGVAEATPADRRCQDELVAWDQIASADAIGPTVFAEYQVQLLRAGLGTRLDAADVPWVMGSVSSGRSPLMVQRFDDEVAAALDEACRVLTERHGEDMSAWTWGLVHPLALQHPYGARSKLLSGWNMPEVPWGGTGTTVAAAGWSLARADRKTTGMQSLRFVAPLSDLGAATMVYPGGQSGQPGHPNYSDQFGTFVDGGVLPLWFDEEDVARATVDTLVLVPGGAAVVER